MSNIEATAIFDSMTFFIVQKPDGDLDYVLWV